jgi:hypothetical protein
VVSISIRRPFHAGAFRCIEKNPFWRRKDLFACGNRTEQKIVLFFHFYSYSLKYLNDTPLAAAKFQY